MYLEIVTHDWSYWSLCFGKTGGYSLMKAGDCLPFNVRKIKDKTSSFRSRRRGTAHILYAFWDRQLPEFPHHLGPASYLDHLFDLLPILWIYFASWCHGHIQFFHFRRQRIRSYLYYVLFISGGYCFRWRLTLFLSVSLAGFNLVGQHMPSDVHAFTSWWAASSLSHTFNGKQYPRIHIIMLILPCQRLCIPVSLLIRINIASRWQRQSHWLR